MPRVYTVLVADDDALVLDVVAKILAGPGYTVITARDGHEAIRILADRDVDLVITDIKMPGLDGIQLSIQAKAMRPDLHIIYITGFARPHNGLNYGLVLEKPVRAADLIRTIENEMSGP